MAAPEPKDDVKLFLIALAGTAFMGVIAVVIGKLTGIDLQALLFWSWRDACIGLAATAPMIAFLVWLMRTGVPSMVRFRESQIEFFANVGFRFTPVRMIAMALFAGIFEELLFRGALMTLVTNYAPVSIAILLSGALFGVVHWRTAFYALTAGVIGIWMGVLFAFTGNLLTPIVTHAVYDIVALLLTAREIDQLNAKQTA